ncbi:FAD/NAD(P)-binding protein [Lentzea sp. NBRC 102530]|uniref:FAD/NAD(P)-binding protein n=1 Tax=Lentzea sp. NBRC 102530 TaxID=3032201 RepID=UPI0024A06E68|nr:FAD/NAD(P)-binding protein [Lentzea sp. NBRC 102530]GLY54475.1 adenylate cyclase [Lentzea sp. NBRC 102530]
MTAVLAIIGAGPRGTGLLERLSANAGLLPSGFEVHVIDPHPAGAGRVWRPEQSPLMLMNSRAGDVTMFPDSSVRCAGPITPGPTLAEWAGLHGDDFPTRRLGGAYLSWCFDRAVRAFPSHAKVVVHRTSAVELSGDTVALADGSRVVADVVVMAQGNVGGHRTEEQRAHEEFAARIGGTYLGPACPGDEDLDVLPAGEPVLVSGLGLAFVDLAVLLTEGRGGRFTREDGTLTYHPSGREPVLHAGSRRGVPYLPKPLLPPLADPAPRFFTPDLLARSDRAGELVGAACQEMLWAHYRELFAAHPGRTRLPWADFAPRFASLPVTDPALEDLVSQAVPAEEDRADLSFLRAPLTAGFAGQHALDTWMLDHLGRAVARATSPRHSAHAAVLHGLLTVSDVLAQAPATPATARTSAVLSRFAAYVGSGPPPHRVEQLRALARAGVLHFLGAGMHVTRTSDSFSARTDSLPAEVTARHFVEARLPDPDARTHALLTPLAQDRPRVPVDPDTFQVPGHPRRLAMGLFADGGALGALSRPNRNAPFFRQNDDTARRVLTELAPR